jgi:hypothetical protein
VRDLLGGDGRAQGSRLSLLLVGLEGALGEAVITKLREAGDDVRVVEPDEGAARRWAALGAHVARGSPLDADLVDRASHGVRTVVVFLHSRAHPPAELLAAVLGEGARPGFRLVACAASLPADARDAIESSGVDHVILVGAATRWSLRRRVSVERLAAAVDAADDLSGTPRLVLDLGRAEDRAALGL